MPGVEIEKVDKRRLTRIMTEHIREGEDVISESSGSDDFGACDREDMYSGEMPSKATVDFRPQEQIDAEQRRSAKSYSPDIKIKKLISILKKLPKLYKFCSYRYYTW